MVSRSHWWESYYSLLLAVYVLFAILAPCVPSYAYNEVSNDGDGQEANAGRHSPQLDDPSHPVVYNNQSVDVHNSHYNFYHTPRGLHDAACSRPALICNPQRPSVCNLAYIHILPYLSPPASTHYVYRDGPHVSTSFSHRGPNNGVPPSSFHQYEGQEKPLALTAPPQIRNNPGQVYPSSSNVHEERRRPPVNHPAQPAPYNARVPQNNYRESNRSPPYQHGKQDQPQVHAPVPFKPANVSVPPRNHYEPDRGQDISLNSIFFYRSNVDKASNVSVEAEESRLNIGSDRNTNYHGSTPVVRPQAANLPYPSPNNHDVYNTRPSNPSLPPNYVYVGRRPATPDSQHHHPQLLHYVPPPLRRPFPVNSLSFVESTSQKGGRISNVSVDSDVVHLSVGNTENINYPPGYYGPRPVTNFPPPGYHNLEVSLRLLRWLIDV